MTGNLVTTTFASNTNGLGSYDPSTQTAMVLAGNQGGSGTKTVDLYHVPQFDHSNSRIDIYVDKIPDTELGVLTTPVRVARYDTDASTNPITVTLPQMGAWDAYVITLSQPIRASALPTLTTLSPSNTPAVHNTNTPVVSHKPADINSDGKVDIFDYNLIITNFGKTGAAGFTSSDIDTNGKVDIFDYNTLISNFGK